MTAGATYTASLNFNDTAGPNFPLALSQDAPPAQAPLLPNFPTGNKQVAITAVERASLTSTLNVNVLLRDGAAGHSFVFSAILQKLG